MDRPSDWTETDSATNDTATASHAAVTDRRHVITTVVASFDAAAVGLLQIKKGTDVVLEVQVHNMVQLTDLHIRGDDNELVSAELAAGGSGVDGHVGIVGYSE